MLSATKGGVGYSFTYDNLARLKTQTDIYGLVQTFTYNAANDRTQVSSSISVEDSVYDAAHRLTSRTSNNIGVSGAKVEFNYDNRNLLTETKRYSDSAGLTLIGSTVLGYDNGGRLTNQDHKNAAGTILVSYINAYDSANRITSETRNGTPKSYNYDSKSQLTSDGTSSYTYDANGNRTMVGYNIVGANRIQSDGVSTYLYDDEGNTTRKTNIASGNYWLYQYDNRNEMTVAESYNSSGMLVKRVEYTYDVFGNMVTEAVVVGGSSVTKFAYRIGNTGTGFTKSVHELWAEVNTSSGVVATRLYLMGDGEGSRLARSDSSGVAWLLQDRLGNVREVTDNTGTINKEVNYDGFGKIVSNTGTGTLGRFTYTGLLQSDETGLVNAHWRWYDLETGTWRTEDPIGFTAGDMNTRRYVGNNGVNSTDRNGLQDEKTLGPSFDGKPLTTTQNEDIDKRILAFKADMRDEETRIKMKKADMKATAGSKPIEFDLDGTYLLFDSNAKKTYSGTVGKSPFVFVDNTAVALRSVGKDGKNVRTNTVAPFGGMVFGYVDVSTETLKFDAFQFVRLTTYEENPAFKDGDKREMAWISFSSPKLIQTFGLGGKFTIKNDGMWVLDTNGEQKGPGTFKYPTTFSKVSNLFLMTDSPSTTFLAGSTLAVVSPGKRYAVEEDFFTLIVDPTSQKVLGYTNWATRATVNKLGSVAPLPLSVRRIGTGMPTAAQMPSGMTEKMITDVIKKNYAKK